MMPVAKGRHRDAVGGAIDAVEYISTRNEQRCNAPDTSPSRRLGAQSGVCGAIVAWVLGQGLPWRAHSALHPSALAANAIRRHGAKRP